MKKAAIILAFLFLAGCQKVDVQDPLRLWVQQMQGKPVSMALQYLGDPSRNKEKISGKKMHSWIVVLESSIPRGEDSPGKDVLYVSEGVYYDNPVPYKWHCRLDVLTDETQNIVHAQYHGEQTGCQFFRERLKAFAAAAGKK